MPAPDPTQHPIPECLADQVNWRKSSRSLNGNDCVETARLEPPHGHIVVFRDSKEPAGPLLTLGLRHWQALADRIKRGHHDLR